MPHPQGPGTQPSPSRVPAPIPGVFDCPNPNLLSLATTVASMKAHLVDMDKVLDDLKEEKDAIEEQLTPITEELAKINKKIDWLRCAKEQFLASLG